MELPDELVHQLNALGFALTEIGRVNTFARAAIGSEVYLTVEPLGQDIWRVGVKWRRPVEWGRTPNPIVPISLGRFGRSSDGATIDLPTSDLLSSLPRLLGESVLPMVDLAPS
jgi:hypothetical protein